MDCKLILFPKNSQLFRLRGLKFPAIQDDGSVAKNVVNDADLTATLYDGEFNPVTGCENVPLTNVGSPPVGDYFGQIDGVTFNPKPGTDYTMIVDGPSGSGRLHIPYEVEVRRRRE